MKTLLLLCLMFSCLIASARAQAPAADAPAAPPTTTTAAAATAQDAPDLSVLKFGWTKERVNWEGDPFGGTVENFDDLRRRMADQRRLERAQRGGNIGEAAKVEREMRAERVIKERPPAPPRYAFLYKASVKNAGAKAIKEIDWDYVFFDAVTGQELGRREFTSVEKIGPGKSKELSFLVPTPPSKTISVYALDKKERDGLRDQIVVMRVLYADGTVWSRQ